jgi:type I restriction enzyme R subunit
MNRYTNSQLTSAEVIADLIGVAIEVSEESKRGAKFNPPLDHDQFVYTTPSPPTSPRAQAGRKTC